MAHQALAGLLRYNHGHAVRSLSIGYEKTGQLLDRWYANPYQDPLEYAIEMTCKVTWSEFAKESVGTTLLDLLVTGTDAA